jgi:hypothetical protein
VIGGFCEHSPVVRELVAEFADMAAKDTAKEHGWQLKEATSYQREAPHTQRLATGAWRGSHENKIARLPYVDPSTEYARTLRHLQALNARWRAEKNRAQSTVVHPWDAGSGRRSRGAHTALRHLPRSKRAKAQHVQRDRGAAYVVKQQLVSQKSQVTRANRLQPLTRNPRTDRHARHGAFDATEST